SEITNQLNKYNIKRLGFEENDVSFKQFTQFNHTCDVELIPTSDIVENVRLIKTQDELLILQEAAKIADNAFSEILNYIKPGVKEIDVSNERERLMLARGATSSTFDTIVAAGYRGALPHGVASEKEIQTVALVTMHFRAVYNGYC